MKNQLPNLRLKPTEILDLEYLFQFQLDTEGGYLAAFMPENPRDKDAYLAKHTQLLQNPNVHKRTILVNNQVVGCLDKFEIDGDAEITYWIDKQYWRQGIATEALREFLTLENSRPLYGRVAFDNLGSQKVLEKCGFKKVGTEKNYANARQNEIEEFIYMLA